MNPKVTTEERVYWPAKNRAGLPTSHRALIGHRLIIFGWFLKWISWGADRRGQPLFHPLWFAKTPLGLLPEGDLLNNHGDSTCAPC